MEFLDPSMTPFVSTFLFVFAVVFGLLVYSKVGNFDRKVNAIIALAIALFSTLYEPLVASLQEFMPLAVVLLIVLFFVIFLKKIVTPKEKEDAFPLAAALAILLLLFGVLGDKITRYIPVSIDPITFAWIAGILLVVLFFVAIYQQKQGG